MKYLKRMLTAAGCIVLSLTMCSCNFDFTFDLNDLFERGERAEEISYQEPPKIEVSDYYSIPYDSPVERNLTEQEIEIYNLICYYIEDYELEFHFEEVEEDTVINAYIAVMNDHPEYFWLNKGYRYTKSALGDHTEIDFVPTSNGTESTIPVKNDRFQMKVQYIVEKAQKQESLYDQVLFVHDYIVENTHYDTEAAENKDTDTKQYFDSSTAYGCLINGKAVCSGYSAAFQYIMKRLGIPSGRITGQSVESGERHEWNYVTLGDYNYQMDVTWDDASVKNSDGEISERKCYDYFLITTEEAELTHDIDRNQAIPSCNGLEYNYFIYNDLYLEEYSFEYAAYMIREHIEEGSVSIKFSTFEEREKAYDELIENNRVFEIEGVGRGITYIKSNNGLILTITSN